VRPVGFDAALGDVAVEQVHAAGIALLADLGEQLPDGHGGVGGAASAQVVDFGKYPDFKGQWDRTGPPNNWRQTAGPPPLTPEYQKVFDESVAQQRAGKPGNWPSTFCIPEGMPAMMNLYNPMEIIITPLNDSMVDLDILGLVDPVTLELTGTSHYADVVHKAVHQRRALDGTRPDWIVVRNRLSGAVTGNKRIVAAALEALSGVLGFRFLDGFAERAVYREFFARGLTALDPLDIAVLGTRPSLSHAAAQEEVCALLGALRLPAYDRRRQAAARLQPTAAHQPVAFQDIRVD